MPGTEQNTPPRATPLLHVLLAALAAVVLDVPVVRLRSGTSLSLLDITGPWAWASLALLGLLVAWAVLMMARDRVRWARLLLLDLGIILALLPTVVGLVVEWDTPPGGIAGLAWGFWLAVALLALRMPLTLWVRSQAAKMRVTGGNDRGA